MNPKKFPMPTGMLLKTDDEEKFLPFQNPTTYKDITVELKPNGEALRVYVTADTSPVQRVTLYFADPLPEKAQVLGGVWERGQLQKVFSYPVHAAVIGTAITRPRDITRRFVEAIS